MIYYPDKWMIIHIGSGERSHYRVFACWYGGWAGSDSWKMNSGITEVTIAEDGMIHFAGASGSVHACRPDAFGCSSYGHGILSHYIEEGKKSGLMDISVLHPGTDYTTIDYTDGAPYAAMETTQEWDWHDVWTI